MAETTELRTKISTQVMDTAKDQVARKLIQNWDNLTQVMPTLPAKPPTAAEMMGDPKAPEGSLARMGIAGQLIMNRETKIGGVDLKLEKLDETLDEYVKNFSAAIPGLENMRNSIGRVQEIIPTKDALNEITDATMRGVQSQQGTGNKIMSFLSAAFSWIVSLISSLFTGEKALSFSEAMAQTAAPGVRDAVKGELQALANDPTKKSSKLLKLQDANGKSAIDTIGDRAYSETYTELGATPPAPAKGAVQLPKLEDVKPEAFDRGMVRSIIVDQIKNPPPVKGVAQPTLSDQIFKELQTGRDAMKKDANIVVRFFMPTDVKLKLAADKMANNIANTVSDRLSDPAFAKKVVSGGKDGNALGKEEFGKLMADEVVAEMKKAVADGTLTLPMDLDGKTKDAKGKETTFGDIMKTQIAAQVGERYEEMKPALLVIGAQEPVKVTSTAKTPGTLVSRIDVGVTGGRETSHKDLGGFAPQGSAGTGRGMELT